MPLVVPSIDQIADPLVARTSIPNGTITGSMSSKKESNNVPKDTTTWSISPEEDTISKASEEDVLVDSYLTQWKTFII